MPALICPGAEYLPQPGAVDLDTSLPPRGVWHITWDALTNGHQPPPENVANYLMSVGYCPNIMWDPFTGKIWQFYPANKGGRALKYNNQDGKVCIQVEVFFTPGAVVNGKTYNTVAETPCKNLETILAWMESWGVPRTWPMGSPQWTNNSRDVDTWNRNAGHYGHCNSPGDDHTDPGPMPSFARPSTQSAKDEFDMATPQQVVDLLLGTKVQKGDKSGEITLAQLLAWYDPNRAKDLEAIFTRPVSRAGGQTGVTNLQSTLAWLDANLQKIVSAEAGQNAQITALVGAVAAVAKGQPFDQEKLLASIQAATAAGVKDAIASIDTTVTLTK